ncbi:MAG: RnfABCDGE type electron transport complex subunit D, partial [Planctomycetota bacterium]
MAQGKRLTKILQGQPTNRRVVVALLPCVLGSVYFFGWRCLFLVIWAGAVGFVVEFVLSRRRGEPVTEAVFVTSTIFALIMPPTVGLHVLTIGVAFAVAFAKEVFGGFGRNVFNPAMAGRCFVYICFPIALTSTWSVAADGPLGALNKWTTAAGADAVTGATPMAHLKADRIVLARGDSQKALEHVPFEIAQDQHVHVKTSAFLKALALGRISGTMGVTSVILILAGGIYLFV